MAKAVPVYSRLADDLRRQVDDGVYAPGHCIGTESELCQAWGVSRSTVRRALNDLAGTGLLVSRQGLGWFVREAGFHQRLVQLEPLNDSLSRQGATVSFQVKSFQFVEAPPHIAAALKIEGETSVLEIERVHLLDDEPLAIVRIWLVEWVGKRLTLEDARASAIFPVLPSRAAVRIDTSSQVIKAAAIGKEDGKLLGLPAGSPVLQVDRTSYTKAGQPIAYTLFLYHPDRFDLRMNLKWTEAEPIFAPGVGLTKQAGAGASLAVASSSTPRDQS